MQNQDPIKKKNEEQKTTPPPNNITMQDEDLYQRCNKLQSTILAAPHPFLMQDIAEKLKNAGNQYMAQQCTAPWFHAYLAEIEA